MDIRKLISKMTELDTAQVVTESVETKKQLNESSIMEELMKDTRLDEADPYVRNANGQVWTDSNGKPIRNANAPAPKQPVNMAQGVGADNWETSYQVPATNPQPAQGQARTFAAPDTTIKPSQVGQATQAAPQAKKPAAFTKDELVGQGDYLIKRGDTFNAIAKAHGITPAELKAANPQIRDVNRIAAGAKLAIPGQPADAGQATQPAPTAQGPENTPPVQGAPEPRTSAAVAADADNDMNADNNDPEAQLFVQDQPTAARQLANAILGPGTDEEAIHNTLRQVKSAQDWTQLQYDYKKATGNDLIADLKDDLDDTDMNRYVWDVLKPAGITASGPAAPAVSDEDEAALSRDLATGNDAEADRYALSPERQAQADRVAARMQPNADLQANMDRVADRANGQSANDLDRILQLAGQLSPADKAKLAQELNGSGQAAQSARSSSNANPDSFDW